MPEKRFLAGQVAWVSGAGRGIGRTIAQRLAEAGALVCLGGRRLDALQQVAGIIRADGGKAEAIELDVTRLESVQAFGATAIERTGPPSIVVNNAGWALFRSMADMEAEDFDRQIDVNLKGPWYLIKEALPHLRRLGGGTILNIGSIAGRVAFKRGSGYCPAKAGLHALTEVLLHELRDDGIRAVTIAPGSVQTGFHKEALPGAHHNDQTWMLDPGTIADACLHVLSLPENALVNYYEVRPLRTGKQS